jgi:DNA-binding PadR family transcriptional regulator
MMLLVLVHLAGVGSAESGEVAVRLRLNRKYVSLVLCRCKRRGFVSRTAYRRGRERGYIYELTEKGAQWILRKSSSKETVPVPPKPEKEFVKVPVPVIVYEQPKSQFDELLGSLKDLHILRTTQAAHDTVPPMSELEMRTLRRQEESEAGFLLYMSEEERRMKDEELLAEVVKGYQERFSDLLRFLKSTGAAVSQRSPLLGARLEAGMTGPESGIGEVSSRQESSKAEVAKEKPVPDVSSDDIELNRWWNNLPTVTFKPPKSLFHGSIPNILQRDGFGGLSPEPAKTRGT